MNKKKTIQRIAIERIYRLFELAEKEFKEHAERSNRYIELALRIGKRCNVRIPRELKKKYCKKCHSFLKEGLNAKTRISSSILKITCLKCNTTKKISATKKDRKALKTSLERKKKQ